MSELPLRAPGADPSFRARFSGTAAVSADERLPIVEDVHAGAQQAPTAVVAGGS